MSAIMHVLEKEDSGDLKSRVVDLTEVTYTESKFIEEVEDEVYDVDDDDSKAEEEAEEEVSTSSGTIEFNFKDNSSFEIDQNKGTTMFYVFDTYGKLITETDNIVELEKAIMRAKFDVIEIEEDDGMPEDDKVVEPPS